jgi:hypothetical protein
LTLLHIVVPYLPHRNFHIVIFLSQTPLNPALQPWIDPLRFYFAFVISFRSPSRKTRK